MTRGRHYSTAAERADWGKGWEHYPRDWEGHPSPAWLDGWYDHGRFLDRQQEAREDAAWERSHND